VERGAANTSQSLNLSESVQISHSFSLYVYIYMYVCIMHIYNVYSDNMYIHVYINDS
jgi:hypothetical protein